jgi:hypothetical protein
MIENKSTKVQKGKTLKKLSSDISLAQLILSVCNITVERKK